MKKKRVTQITEALNSLNKKDIYSMLMFTLYKLKDDPTYTGLSELCYLLDGNSLSKLLTYYGGMTITIPTLKEMRLITKALSIYQYVNIEGEDLEETIKAVSDNEFREDELKATYARVLNVIAEYQFGE